MEKIVNNEKEPEHELQLSFSRNIINVSISIRGVRIETHQNRSASPI